MDSLIRIMKDLLSRSFTMFLFYTPWNYPSKLRFSHVFREYKRGTLGKNKSRFLTYFSPVSLFCTPWERQKTLGLVSMWYKIETLRRSGFTLIFSQFKNSLFQGATSINSFRIFKWIISRESLLHRVTGVHKQAGLGSNK